MLFFLTIVADACGIVGGGLVTIFMNHQNGTQYFAMAWEHLRYPDILQGLVKPLFFGYILASIGCFYGMRTTGGTQGVGRSTIQAVVAASVIIIFVDFFITQVCFRSFLPHDGRLQHSPNTDPPPAMDAGPVVAFRATSRSASMARRCWKMSAFLSRPERRASCWDRPAWAKACCSSWSTACSVPTRAASGSSARRYPKCPRSSSFPLRTRTGMVFQEGALFDSLTVRDNVAYQLIQERVPDEEIDSRVREALHFVELEETFSLFPASLSGGMRRRVAIARALIQQAGTAALRLAHRRAGPHHLHHHHRTDREGTRRVPDAVSDGHPPASRRLHPLHPSLRQRTGPHGPPSQGETDAKTTFLMLEEGRLIFDGSLRELLASQNSFVREFLE